MDSKPKVTYLRDYNPHPYLIPSIDLRLELGADYTIVYSKMQVVVAENTAIGTPLLLDGNQLELLEIYLNGKQLTTDQSSFRLEDHYLIILNPPVSFELYTITKIRPSNNLSLEGLYQSHGILCTQCEAQGFRNITYFIDRPDIMTVFTTTLIADKDTYPVLLSNGHIINSGQLTNKLHWVTWHDPFPKPCYLFAVVAGKLSFISDHYITTSGKSINLRIYTEQTQLDQCTHAMRCLKQAMAWEESQFGLEYDLELYQIVAISDFNMGAMENKGLNIFNTKYILAKKETATDADYLSILNVIGHEYFHNWTGNRVTCRDWFQLSVKEGLTVFRDQEFSSAIWSSAIKRIEDVKFLRTIQFPLDAGPIAHPVQPDSYLDINNLYTATIYNKGAEIVRMLQIILGKKAFLDGMRLYLLRHDCKAVTCEDFIQAMEDASFTNLKQFRIWYQQVGTPKLYISDTYDASTNTYNLKVEQQLLPNFKPLHIPILIGLLDADGQDIPLQLAGEIPNVMGFGDKTRLLEIRNPIHVFMFVNIPTKPVLSICRGFSAPIQVNYKESNENLIFRMQYDSDDFNRWDAGQSLALRILLDLIHHKYDEVPNYFSDCIEQLMFSNTEPALLSQLLTLPSQSYLAEHIDIINVEAIHAAYSLVRQTLARRLYKTFIKVYKNLHSNHNKDYFDLTAISRRLLKNLCLDYIMQWSDREALTLCLDQFYSANNMTDHIGALSALNNFTGSARITALNHFYQTWQHDALVVDKWLMLQAVSALPSTLGVVKALLLHEAFDIHNPNKVRALIGSFCQNQLHFHAIDGSGYLFLADQLLKLDSFNPIIAAKIATNFSNWKKFEPLRQEKIHEQLIRILSSKKISPELYEIITKSLGKC